MHTTHGLWETIRERWTAGGAGIPTDAHLRRDIGLAPLPARHSIPVMVLAYAH